MWVMSEVMTDGALDLEKVKGTMAHYAFVEEQVSIFYCELTAGTLSKPNYYAAGVIQAVEENFAKRAEEDESYELSSARQEAIILRAELAALREQIS